MKLSTTFLLSGSLAIAAPSNLAAQDSSSVDVKIESAGNTRVKVTVTNTGAENLRLLKTGSFLSDAPVRKVNVFSEGKPLDFEGMYVTVLPSKLQESSFEDIDASSSIEAFFDIAELYDVSKGGQFSLQSEGVLSFGAPGGRSLIGSISYTSNLLNVNVNGTEATEARALSPLHQKRALVDKRIVVQSDCSGDRHQTILTGLFMCTIYADAAFNKTVAPDANDKMLEYFKRADADTKIHVANGFLKIRNVCGQYTSGDANLFCTDQFNGCHGDTGAYTIPSSSNMVFCPGFFDWHADTPQGCHNPDLGTTVLHEVSHLRQTLATDDYGTYGYDGLRRLSADQNLNHADTYTYYAQALIAHC